MENKNKKNTDALDFIIDSNSIEYINELKLNLLKKDYALEKENIVNDSINSLDGLKSLIIEEKTKENRKGIFDFSNYSEKTKLILDGVKVFFKYLFSSSLIFALLLFSTNYSAYINLIKNYVNKTELEVTKQNIISSVEAANIKEKYKIEKLKELQTKKEEAKKDRLSIKKMKKSQDKESLNLSIEITPYENRVIVPRIGKNIPLIDIKNRNVSGEKELNAIFNKELEKGIIRYPGSAKPGEKGNSFIFGHSSNFPWMKGNYNEVFALLGEVEVGDKVIVYYEQEKYTYIIKEQNVIEPGDVSILKRDKNKKELTLMTCWPIGTTLNRLIVTGELVSE